MIAHLRAIFALIVLTLVLCCVAYPLALLGIGKVAISSQATGSLITKAESGGKEEVRGSRLVAQSFGEAKYFWPRPSAASYNASASSGSNYSGNNYLLRERVAQQLGPMVKYSSLSPRSREPVGPDIEKWLHRHPEVVAAWAKAHPSAPGRWLDGDKTHKEQVAKWKEAENKAGEAEADDVVPFFESYARKKPAEWPDEVKEYVQAVFFEQWRKAHPDADLEPVPADLVTASGSGLDPHITLQGAMYQVDRVAGAWAKDLGVKEGPVRAEIEKLLKEQAGAPLLGLAGVPVVNVLEINLALPERLRALAAK